MTFKKKQFGTELKRKLEDGYTAHMIASWAFDIYLQYGAAFEAGLDDIVLKLVAIEEGPEFDLSIDEISNVADQLLED